MSSKIQFSYDGEDYVLRFGEREARIPRSSILKDCVEAAAALSGLGGDEVEAWKAQPGQDAEKWVVQPKRVYAAIQALRSSLNEEIPPTAPVPEEGLSTQVSRLKASLVDKRVSLNAQIVSEQGQKALPKSLTIQCSKCAEKLKVDLSDPNYFNVLETVIFKGSIPEQTAESLLNKKVGTKCSGGKYHDVAVDKDGYMDYAILGARELLEEMERFDQQAYRACRVHLFGVRPPPAKKIHVIGQVVVDPSSKNICIIADSCEPLESQVAGFTVTDEDRTEWPKWFNGELDISSQVAPDMVGRQNVQQSYLLILHSAAEIPDIYGRRIRGCIRGILFGDTKTNKSESAKDLGRDHYNFGGYVMGETSSRTGITYTINQDEKVIVWGELPCNDLGLVIIDGLHAMFAEEMKELREALESQRIIVRRSVPGEALARTRVIGILNPGKPMNQYPYPCMAVKDSVAFYETPDITRWDLFLAFGLKDVPKEDIARRQPATRPIPDETFKRHVYWAWSRRPEQIRYTEDAKTAIVEASITLMEDYALDALPIVHLGVRDVLCRLTVATAASEHSTDEANDMIIVNEVHVEKAVEFYRDMLDRLMLKQYKIKQEGLLDISPSEFEKIVRDIGETEITILRSIEIHGKSSTNLAAEMDVSEETIQRHYKPLKKHGLITTRPKVGVELAARGVLFLRALTLGIIVIPSNNDDNKDGQQQLPSKNAGNSTIPKVGGNEKPPEDPRVRLRRLATGFMERQPNGSSPRQLFFNFMLEAGFSEEEVISTLANVEGWVFNLIFVQFHPRGAAP